MSMYAGQLSGIFAVQNLQLHQTGMPHNYGLPVSDTDFGDFLSDTAVLRFDTDFN